MMSSIFILNKFIINNLAYSLYIVCMYQGCVIGALLVIESTLTNKNGNGLLFS